MTDMTDALATVTVTEAEFTRLVLAEGVCDALWAHVRDHGADVIPQPVWLAWRTWDALARAEDE